MSDPADTPTTERNVGKNFSGNNLGQRRKADFYETPYSITKLYLELGLMDRSQKTLEPACGGGAIVKVLREAGFSQIEAYDSDRDFLLERRSFSQIITNPPYSKATDFIFKAKSVAVSRFSFLLPLSYLHGKARFDGIYQDTDFPLASVHVLTRYPMLGDPLRTDGRYRTGMMVYAWFHWDRRHVGPPQLGWLDNHSDVLGARLPSGGLLQ